MLCEGLASAQLGRTEKNQDQLLDCFRGIASTLSLGHKTAREGESLVLETKDYYSTGAMEKNLYLGAVLYIAARRCSVPITLYEIASCIGRPHKELIQKYRCALLEPNAQNVQNIVQNPVDAFHGENYANIRVVV